MKATHERVTAKKVSHTATPECSAGVEDASARVLAGRGRLSFEALIFDVDGTLAETEETRRQAFNEAFRACGLDWSWSPELYAELLQVIGGKQRIDAYIARLQLAEHEKARVMRLVPEIHNTKNRLYQQFVDLGLLRPRAGVRRLLIEARTAGIHLAVASTTSPENFDSLIAASFGPEALRWFSAIVTGDVVLRQKPSPDVYNVALAKLGVPAQRAIAFEDSAIGVQAAKAAGLFTVVTPSVWTTAQDFAAADLILPSLGDSEEPLDPADERRIGAKYLGLKQLAAFHFAVLRAAGGSVSTE
jgi:HAD superfamily hydrolase (TIGR01509 family)